jgi:hypothetical protein
VQAALPGSGVPLGAALEMALLRRAGRISVLHMLQASWSHVPFFGGVQAVVPACRSGSAGNNAHRQKLNCFCAVPKVWFLMQRQACGRQYCMQRAGSAMFRQIAWLEVERFVAVYTAALLPSTS